MRAKYLLVSVGTRSCAFALTDVSETMRALRTQPLPDAPAFIAGVATVRGELTVVVSAPVLLSEAGAESRRMVVLKAGPRKFGITVSEVAGIVELDDASGEDLAPLLPSLTSDYVEKLLKLESSFATVLNGARMVPESVWQSLRERQTHG
ncbi:MAG: chemotaxis protein CheW [Bryobacteraceae bacterium]